MISGIWFHRGTREVKLDTAPPEGSHPRADSPVESQLRRQYNNESGKRSITSMITIFLNF